MKARFSLAALAMLFPLTLANSISAHAQALSVLYNFTGGADGDIPTGCLISDAGGNLYGTTTYGGADDEGTVFKVDSASHESVIYSFTAGDLDGSVPNCGLIRHSGNLYGTTEFGGPSNYGTIFKIDASNHESILHFFAGGSDGIEPESSLSLDGAGNVYGTTVYGGDIDCNSVGCGTIYKLNLISGNETVIYAFPGGVLGASASASVVAGSSGNLYGTTLSGGSSSLGVIFQLDSSYQETALYDFTVNDSAPFYTLTRDSEGNLYGVTSPDNGLTADGVVFKLDASGNYSVLHSFTGAKNDGKFPNGPLILDPKGNLYGTTWQGGEFGLGTIYRVNSSTGAFVVVHSFSGSDGSDPNGRLLLASGNLYGACQGGGTYSQGVIFKIVP
jgi:uncharacterized repeat protein (TIGR03803 family)